jgi:hypothetical protein
MIEPTMHPASVAPDASATSSHRTPFQPHTVGPALWLKMLPSCTRAKWPPNQSPSSGNVALTEGRRPTYGPPRHKTSPLRTINISRTISSGQTTEPVP